MISSFPALAAPGGFPRRSFLPVVLFALLLLFGVAGFIWFSSSRNPYTPAGYVGYLTRGAVLGRAEFVGLQTGPTSTGRGWLLDVTNVSVTPYTYTEDFTNTETVLAKDNLKIAFQVHIVWRVRPEKVRELVEKYSTLQPGDSPDQIVKVCYDNFLKQPLRTFARDEVQQLKGLEIKDSISPLGQRIRERVVQTAAGSPFQIDSVVVGNIQYPPEIVEAVSRKLAATQELERKQTEIAIAERDKEKRIVEAEGLAKAAEVINQRLTPLYLQYEAVKAQQAMIGSPNHTTIYIPVGPMGVPLVGTLDPEAKAEPAAAKPGTKPGGVPASQP